MVSNICFQKKEKGNLRLHHLNNVEKAMSLLEKNNVRYASENKMAAESSPHMSLKAK